MDSWLYNRKLLRFKNMYAALSPWWRFYLNFVIWGQINANFHMMQSIRALYYEYLLRYRFSILNANFKNEVSVSKHVTFYATSQLKDFNEIKET